LAHDVIGNTIVIACNSRDLSRESLASRSLKYEQPQDGAISAQIANNSSSLFRCIVRIQNTMEATVLGVDAKECIYFCNLSKGLFVEDAI
jgi:hypothetical protein